MTGFRVGETVDITIRGAKIHSVSNRLVAVTLPNGMQVLVDPTSDAVTVTRTDPPEWPPQLGDVWLDRNGDPWFCARLGMGAGNDRQHWFFYGADGDDKYIDKVVADVGPLTLALRLAVDEVAS